MRHGLELVEKWWEKHHRPYLSRTNGVKIARVWIPPPTRCDGTATADEIAEAIPLDRDGGIVAVARLAHEEAHPKKSIDEHQKDADVTYPRYLQSSNHALTQSRDVTYSRYL